MVGNSSAALREGAFLGTPAVTVGTASRPRDAARNVDVRRHDRGRDRGRDSRAQLEHGRYEPDRFRRRDAGVRIADVLATARPTIQKHLELDLVGAAEIEARSES